MKKAVLIIGIALILESLVGMLAFHEYGISEITFIGGLTLIAFVYYVSAKPIPKINTEKVNENIQTLNDILWGKQEK